MNVQKYLRMAHTSSVLISVVINGLLLAAMITFITIQEEREREVGTVMVIEPTEQEEIEELEEIEPEEVEELEDLEAADFTMDNPLDTEFEQEPEPMDQPQQTEVAQLTELMSDVASPVQMTGLMMGRNAAGRKEALKQYGQGLGKVTEPAVRKALEWLRDHQRPNGSWQETGSLTRGSGNTGYTGLALLAFLAHGETPSSKEFGRTVANGIRFIVEGQDAQGIFQPAGGHTSYGHAMATYALAEAYTMTENVLLKEPLQRGVQAIMDGQQERGGYDYDYAKDRNRNDISVGIWQLQAMKAAYIAMPEYPGLKEHLQRGMDGILMGSHATDVGRRFVYKVSQSGSGDLSGGREILSAGGALTLHLSGRGSSSESREAMEYLEQHVKQDRLPKWGRIQTVDEGGGEVMFWYYAVQAYFQDDRDGSDFKRFYPAMVEALVKNQAEDGHWDDFTPKGKTRGPVFTTTLGSLALMVTYRYLPTTQRDVIRPGPPASEPAEEPDEEIEFEI